MVDDWNPTPPSIPQVVHRAWAPTVAAPIAETETGWRELKDGNGSGAGSGLGLALLNLALIKAISNPSGSGLSAATVITILQAIGSGSAAAPVAVPKPLVQFVPNAGAGTAAGGIKALATPSGSGSGTGPAALGLASGISASSNPSGAGPAVIPIAYGLVASSNPSAAGAVGAKLRPVYTAASTCPTTTNNTTQGSWSHAGGSYSDMCAIMVVQGLGSDLRSAYTATYGGVSMTLLTSLRGNGSDNGSNLAVFKLDNCASGTQTAVINCSVGTNIHKAHVITYRNAKATSLVQTATGFSGSMSITGSSATGDLMFTVFVAGEGAIAGGFTIGSYSGNQRVNYNSDISIWTQNSLACGDYAGASSVTSTAVYSRSDNWCAAAVNITG